VVFGIWLLALFAAFAMDAYATTLGRSGVTTVPTAGSRDRAEGQLSLLDDGRWRDLTVPDRVAALTFEDGPDPRWTPAVLDALAEADVRATFFVVGSRVNQHPDLVRRMVAEGHEVGAQTFTHTDLATQPRWRRHLELTLTQNAIIAATGRPAALYRPPYTASREAMSPAGLMALRDVAGGGYLVSFADTDTGDWRRGTVADVVDAGTPRSGRGAVILLHDGGGDRSRTVAALGPLVDRLVDRGYRLTTVSRATKARVTPAAPSRGELLRARSARAAQDTAALTRTGMAVLLSVGMVIFIVRMVVQVPLALVHAARPRRRRRGRRRLGRPPLSPGVLPVTVIVPAYNESANIAATVRSLLDTDYPDLDVIVVDDGSTDGTADIVEGLGLPRVLVVRQANGGKPAALNHGISLCTSELVILVDGDTVFQPDTVPLLVQPFADPRVGAVSGNTKVANRFRLLGRWQHIEYVIGFNLDRRMFDIARCIATVPGAIGAFRRAALADVGGISEDTLAEDTDVTMSLLRHGWEVVYEGRALAWTEVPSTLRQLWRQRYRWCYGTLQCVWKHRRAVLERGPGGRLGRIGLTYLMLFQVVLPVTAPLADVYALCGLLFQQWGTITLIWVSMLGIQLVLAALALRLDDESVRPLWTVPLQQLVYRQFLYLVVIQSVVTALVGSRLRWHRMARTGAATAVLAARAPLPAGSR